MKLKNGNEYSRNTVISGRFATPRHRSPFSQFVECEIVNESLCDETFSDDGLFIARIGKRIFSQDSQGFCEVWRGYDVADAMRDFRILSGTDLLAWDER